MPEAWRSWSVLTRKRLNPVPGSFSFQNILGRDAEVGDSVVWTWPESVFLILKCLLSKSLGQKNAEGKCE